MIHIEKDQQILEERNLKVDSETGDYNDTDLINFYDISKPGVVAGSFQAQYVKYGGLVYKFNEPRELGEAILKIDPESTHSAASFVRMSNELLAQMNGGTLQESSLENITAEENVKVVDDTKKERKIDTDKDEEEDDLKIVPITPDIHTSTTTPTISRDVVETVVDDVRFVVEEVGSKAEEVGKTVERLSDAIETIVR